MDELLPFSGKPEAPKAPPARYVRVVVERGIDERGGLDGLTYASLDPDIAVGERVEVPLGRGDKPAGGIVVAVGGRELLDGFPPDKVKRLLSRSGASLPDRLVELARWIAAYTVTPLGLVLATMMPSAVKQGIGRRIEKRLEPLDPALIEPKVRTLTPKLLETWQKVRGVSEGAPDSFPMLQADLVSRIGPDALRPLRKLITLGLVRTVEVPVVTSRGREATPLESASRRSDVPDLTPTQAATVTGIAADLGRFAVHLIRGVTGSGKTEVYLRLIEQAHARGKGSIVLVPEIALTPQVESIFRARLGPLGMGVAVLHSGLSASQRHREWERVATGEARVVVGPRSAVFAPMADLGLIVVDEEHDHSYKHEQLPRYNARDVAVKRGQIEGCPVVLGSATPSLESWANATGPSPRFALWSMPQRVAGGRSMPAVRILDMADERRALAAAKIDPSSRGIGPTLAAAIARTLDDNGQVILLLNRRGYASFLVCSSPACGWSMRCDACDANLVFHRAPTPSTPAGGYVRCHHCLAEQKLPKACPACDRPLAQLNAGTQRVEEELAHLFGTSHGLSMGSTMLRLDSDTMTSAADYADALSRFEKGQARLILGTQMIAKGLDFPNVRLVGVLSADTALNLPDFRAAERTFQLVSQVAGRAGRGEHPGLVLIQTMNPTNPAIIHAAAHDYVTFADAELALRRAASLPPAVRMARIVCRELDAGEARQRALDLTLRLRQEPDLSVVGPMEAPISRIALYYRFAVEITSPTAGALQRALTALRTQGLLKSDTRTAVDVDPLNLL